MTRFLCAVVLVVTASVLNAQTTKPIRYTWIATSCETWNCAAAALVLANGDKDVLVLPTGQADTPWIILRRVEQGSVYIPEDEPFACEVFTSSAEATARFEGMERCHGPLMLSVPDGRMVIASLQTCGGGTSKRRAVQRR